jgi:1,4-alpha-glucan branching enzyme
MTSLTSEAYAVIEGRHSDPFRYLGPHAENGSAVVRVFLPDAEGVAVIDEQGHESDLRRIHDAGLFEGRLRNGSQHYRLRARYGERQVEIEELSLPAGIFVPEAKPGNWLAGKDRASEVTMNDLTAELRLRGLEPPYDVVKQELAISQGAAADGLAVTGGRQRRRRFKARPYSC